MQQDRKRSTHTSGMPNTSDTKHSPVDCEPEQPNTGSATKHQTLDHDTTSILNTSTGPHKEDYSTLMTCADRRRMTCRMAQRAYRMTTFTEF